MRLAPFLLAFALSRAVFAADVEVPEHSAVLPEESLATDGVALARLGYRVSLVPAGWRFVRRDGFAALAHSPYGVVVNSSRERGFVKPLRSYASEAKCRVVVRGEGGLTLDEAASLGSIGPCFFEIHVANDPDAWARAFSGLRPASIVWEVGAVLPALPAITRFARLSQPVLAIDDEAAVAACDLLERLNDERLSLRIRARSGLLSPATLKALQRPGRAFRVTVVAQDGLDLRAARELRGLSRASVELALERPAIRPGLLEAAGALARPVDPLDQRRLTDDEADAPLLHPR